MSDRRLNPLALLVVGLAVVFLTAGDVAGQGREDRADLPRTPWGDPDLQGVWNNNTVVPLERPEVLAGKDVLTQEEVAARFQATSDATFAKRDGDPGFYNEFWFEYGKDTNRTSLVIDPPDGRLPSLTPRGQARADAGAHKFPDGIEPVASWDELSLFDRCITRGLPGAMSHGFYNHNYHILQTPDHVVLVVEMIHDARIIPLDGRDPVGDDIRQWLGDSRGHWEGDTLVVETTNFTDKTNTRMQTVFGGSRSLRPSSGSGGSTRTISTISTPLRMPSSTPAPGQPRFPSARSADRSSKVRLPRGKLCDRGDPRGLACHRGGAERLTLVS